jgi:hypothetical protein
MLYFTTMQIFNIENLYFSLGKNDRSLDLLPRVQFVNHARSLRKKWPPILSIKHEIYATKIVLLNSYFKKMNGMTFVLYSLYFVDQINVQSFFLILRVHAL